MSCFCSCHIAKCLNSPISYPNTLHKSLLRWSMSNSLCNYPWFCSESEEPGCGSLMKGIISVLEWKGTPGKVCVVQKDIMGLRRYISIRMQTELGSSRLRVLGSLVFIPFYPRWQQGCTSEPRANREKLESSKDMNLSSYFEAGHCPGLLGLIPNTGKTYWLQQAGAWFAPGFLGAPKSEWEPNLALNLQDRALGGFALSWNRLFPSLWGRQGGEERNYINSPKKNKART